MANNDSISDNIYISRDAIREQITNEIKDYLELQDVDLTKSSFLSFVIDIISKVTGNLLFYQTNMYREFFLTKAQLPESILNLSAFLGYNTKEATYAESNLLFSIPLNFEIEESYFKIPKGFKFSAGTIPFITYFNTEIFISNNISGRIKVTTDDGRIYNLPSSIDTETETLNFILPVRQYEILYQQFQVDSDLREYSFVTFDVPVNGKVANMNVRVTEAGQDASQAILYEEVNSLYLMSATTRGYVSRRTDEGRRLYFGNGLIGIQPPANASIDIEVTVTKGADGNVIAGSITGGDKIYNSKITIDGIEYNSSYNNKTKIVNYDAVNTSSAINGSDEEGLEDIRQNSIAHISALERLVSEGDYHNADVVVDDSPFASKPLPVLKRSDLKQNEVQLYSNLTYEDKVVPTRNLTIVYDSGEFATDVFPRGTIIEDNGVEFETLFDIKVEHDRATYQYVADYIETTPSLVFNSEDYDVIVTKTSFERVDLRGVFKLYYENRQSGLDNSLISCSFEVSPNNFLGQMVNDPDNNVFTFTFDEYFDITEGDIDVNYTLVTGSTAIASYQTSLVYSSQFNNFMYSNLIKDTDVGQSTIYDVPCIKRDYYNSIDKNIFETLVLQQIAKFNFKSIRMLTDFTNIKFSNSIGKLVNMSYNKTNKFPVVSRSQLEVPTAPILGDRYIINGREGGVWQGLTNKIAICVQSDPDLIGIPIEWKYLSPVSDDIVEILDESKKYIFCEYGWIIPEYDIPLKLELEVFRVSNYVGGDNALSTNVKSTIVNYFSPKFGSNIEIYRSEIIDVVQGIVGVSHCRLIEPQSNIFFNFDIGDFSQDKLLLYTPEYIFFGVENISVTIL